VTHIDEAELPGVGTRFSFETDRRRVLGVIRHHDGRRELFVTDDDDPDCVAVAVSLEEGEAHVLADLLGGSEISREAGSAHGVAGLAVNWIEVADATPAAGATIGDLRVRTRTGASVVAVLRADEPHPAPGPGFRLEPGDVVMVVGTAAGARDARRLLQGEREGAP
jgi:TrkA domain protein